MLRSRSSSYIAPQTPESPSPLSHDLHGICCWIVILCRTYLVEFIRCLWPPIVRDYRLLTVHIVPKFRRTMAEATLLYSNHAERTYVEDCASAILPITASIRQLDWCSGRDDHLVHAPSSRIQCTADLFGLLKAMELLETAWIRDNVDADDYQRLCQRLISQKRLLFDGEFKTKVCKS